MSPRNIFRMEEAVMSLLAGSAGNWQTRTRLYLFRAIYYITKLSHLRFRFASAKPVARPQPVMPA